MAESNEVQRAADKGIDAASPQSTSVVQKSGAPAKQNAAAVQQKNGATVQQAPQTTKAEALVRVIGNVGKLASSSGREDLAARLE